MVYVDDPSVKMLRSGFGKQVKSPNNTSSAWGFGTGHRDAYNKLYLSPEQAKAMQGNNSQGAVYKSFSAIGPQPESKYQSSSAPGFGTSSRTLKLPHKNNPGPGAYQNEGAIGNMVESKRSTSPRVMFGTATRDAQSKVWLDDELMKTYAGREGPGPNSYKAYEGIGKQVDSKYSSSPAWRAGSAERFRGHENKDLTNVGFYHQYNALGRQAMSQKKTLPAHKIGTSNRDAVKKIFISKEHEKNAFGEHSPGPVTATHVSSIGRQKLSIKQSNPSWGFGTSKRGEQYANPNPGPGTYYA